MKYYKKKASDRRALGVYRIWQS